MKISEVCSELDLKLISNDNHNDKEIIGVYSCDLLSWAMAKANMGDAWITVHTNLNVIAVAVLTDVACVIIPEGIEIEESTIQRANEKGVIILSSEKSAATICYEMLNLIKGKYNETSI